VTGKTRYVAGKPLSTDVRAGVKPKSVRPGLRYEVYHVDNLQAMPDFDRIKPKRSGAAKAITLDVAKVSENFAMRFTGYVKAPRRGQYTFHLSSDDGSKLWIGDKLIVDNSGMHSVQEKTGSILLGLGHHPITVEYFQGTGDKALAVGWSYPGAEKRTIDPKVLFHSK